MLNLLWLLLSSSITLELYFPFKSLHHTAQKKKRCRKNVIFFKDYGRIILGHLQPFMLPEFFGFNYPSILSVNPLLLPYLFILESFHDCPEKKQDAWFF